MPPTPLLTGVTLLLTVCAAALHCLQMKRSTVVGPGGASVEDSIRTRCVKYTAGLCCSPLERVFIALGCGWHAHWAGFHATRWPFSVGGRCAVWFWSSLAAQLDTRAARHTADVLLQRASRPAALSSAPPASPALPTRPPPCCMHPLPRSYGTFLKRLQDPVIAEVERRVASECEQMRAGSTTCWPACTQRLQGGQAWGVGHAAAMLACCRRAPPPGRPAQRACCLTQLHLQPLVLPLVALQLGRT